MIFELKQWWRILKTIILMVGVLLSFFVLVEVLHIFSIFKDVYPPLGYGFLLLIAAAIVYAIFYLIAAIRKLPKVLQAPGYTGSGSGERETNVVPMPATYSLYNPFAGKSAVVCRRCSIGRLQSQGTARRFEQRTFDHGLAGNHQQAETRDGGATC